MPDTPLTVTARFRAKPGAEDRLMRELLDMISPTRAEPGCIEYALHRAPDDPCLFLFHENWTNCAALDAHFETPHVKALLGRLDGLLAMPIDLQMWRCIDPASPAA